MRRLMAFLVFVAAVILIVGFYRGWFSFGVNQPKIQQDEKQAKHAIDKGVEKVKEGIHKGTEKVEEKTSSN
jgi:hypothetical protein